MRSRPPLTASELEALIRQAAPSWRGHREDLADVVAMLNLYSEVSDRDDLPASEAEAIKDLPPAHEDSAEAAPLMAMIRRLYLRNRQDILRAKVGKAPGWLIEKLHSQQHDAEAAMRASLRRRRAAKPYAADWHGAAAVIAMILRPILSPSEDKLASFKKPNGPLPRATTALLARLGYGTHSPATVARAMERLLK